MPKIKLTKKFRKNIYKIDPKFSKNIFKALKKLSNSDKNLKIKKLKPKNLGLYRLRINSIRIIFKYTNKDIYVIDIGLRNSIYEKY